MSSSPPREDWIWEMDVPTAALSCPRNQVKAVILPEGKLIVEIEGQDKKTKHEVDLPDDAFTDHATAKLDNRKLCVCIPRRDPNGPPMQEKRLLNPDRHPIELDITMSKELLAKGGVKPPPSQDASKTPAQQSAVEFSSELVAEDPSGHFKMPEVNMGSSIVTAMPIMSQGGVMNTVSQGETVVKVPGSADIKQLSGLDKNMSPEELATKLRDTAVHDQPPPGATVLAGQKPAENEAAFDARAMQPAASGTDSAGRGGGTQPEAAPVAAAAAPAGDEEHKRVSGQVGDKVRSDFLATKVGMEYEERTAADMYVGAESKREPISSMKQPGVPLCELCSCAPCQCDKMAKTGGTGNDPFELTAPEQKRGGQPHIHTKHREVTGKNAHEARDFRGHAKQVNESHVGIGAKLGDYQGNVPEGMGDPSDPKYSNLPHPEPRGSTHTGGRPIEMGGPGHRQVSDQAKGGPVTGGHKTTFTTLG